MGIMLYAANEGYLKDIDVAKILPFEDALLAYVHAEHGALMSDIVATGKYDSDVEATFKSAIETFKASQAW
jgi:F-type H+-transporting ATPase subunit alpha